MVKNLSIFQTDEAKPGLTVKYYSCLLFKKNIAWLPYIEAKLDLILK